MNTKLATALLGVFALLVVLVFLLLPSPEPAKNDKEAAPSSALPQPTYSSDLGQPAPSASFPQGASPAEGSAMPSVADWEQNLDDILTKDADSNTVVRDLVSAMPNLPPEGREEFISHAVNLCEDGQFSLIGRVYLDPSTSKEVADIIFNDLLNRPDEIKLPLLAKSVQSAGHPMNAESKEILEMYFDLEPGAVPPGGWEQAVRAYIREQGE